MTNNTLFGAIAALLLLGTTCYGQQFSHDISLSGLGNGEPAKPFGIAYEPSQDLLFVPLAGNGWPGSPNNAVAVIDPATDDVIFTIPCGLYPEEVAFCYNANGNLSYGAVTNSTSGSVTIWDTSLNVVASVQLPDPFSLGTCYPYGIAAAEDGSKFWVSTVDGSGEIYAIDLNTMSVDALAGFTTPFASGSKLQVHQGKLYVGTSRYNATWSDSEASVTVIDLSTGVIQETLLVPEGSGSFPGTQDFQVLIDGRVAVSGLSFNGKTYVLDQNGNLDRTFSQSSGSGAHGMALDANGEVLVCCDLPSNKVVFLDLENHVQISSISLNSVGLGYSQPNDAVFAHGKLYVTSQGTEEIVVFNQLPDPADGIPYQGSISISNSTPLPGDTVTVNVAGSGVVALAMAREGLPGSLRGVHIEIGPNPILLGTASGNFVESGFIPNDPAMRGLHFWLQGGINIGSSTQLTAPKVVVVQ